MPPSALRRDCCILSQNRSQKRAWVLRSRAARPRSADHRRPAQIGVLKTGRFGRTGCSSRCFRCCRKGIPCGHQVGGLDGGRGLADRDDAGQPAAEGRRAIGEKDEGAPGDAGRASGEIDIRQEPACKESQRSVTAGRRTWLKSSHGSGHFVALIFTSSDRDPAPGHGS